MASRNYHLNSVVQEIHDHSISYETREIYLHSHISDEEIEPGVDYRMAMKLLKNLRLLEKTNDPITIHLFSYGGEFYAGNMIYDAINNSPCHINMILHGAAMSMGTIIMQAADCRIAMPSCVFMIHDGSEDVAGTVKQVKSSTEFTDIMCRHHMNIYAGRCKVGEFFQTYSESKIKAYIKNKLKSKEDWYLTAEEALKYGFIDEILGTKHKNLRQIVQGN